MGGTRYTQVAEGEPGGFFRLVGPLLEMAGRRQFRADLGNLKDLLETRREASQGSLSSSCSS